MKRSSFIDLLKRVSIDRFSNKNDNNVSKALGYYFLKRFIETDYTETDFWNSNVDAANDRGFDFIFFDDSLEASIKVYFVQCKYSEVGETSVDENEVTKTINNYLNFPNLGGQLNAKLESKINEYRIYEQNDDIEIEKIGLYINLGKFTVNAKEALERANFEVFDFERFNSELLLDENLPDVSLHFKKSPLKYDDDSFLAILSVQEFLNNSEVRNLINSQRIFHYNVRGLMRNRKNSIAEDIKKTAKQTPEKLFQRNNGLTIICESIEEKSNLEYVLKQTSIINGQQTIRALLATWGDLDESVKSKLALTVKVLGIKTGEEEDRQEILNVAKASNKQNSIKESDLRANEPEQREIEERALLLPEPLRYKYIAKRTIEYPEEPSNYITRDQATLLLSLFINQNPSDRIEGLYKNNYKGIYEAIKPEHIPIIQAIKDNIEQRYTTQDFNTREKFWSEKAYKKFKKTNVLNFSLYLFSVLLSEDLFGYEGKVRKKELLDSLYSDMRMTNNFNVSSYFNQEFWLALQNACMQYIRKKYDEPNTTSDELRKEVNKEEFMREYDNYCSFKASEGPFAPSILIRETVG